ncbi:hypothetical protein GCM10011408_35650 [Dyella caseinilytica]|nr:hypothetical protein GCM10011408_35650 [Dyella caseinilytica]
MLRLSAQVCVLIMRRPVHDCQADLTHFTTLAGGPTAIILAGADTTRGRVLGRVG